MQDCSTNNDGNYAINFVGRTFEVREVGAVLFSVTGLSEGTVTFKYSPFGDDNWYEIHDDLVCTEDTLKYAVLGDCRIRAEGDGSVAGSDLFVGVAGRVFPR